MQNTQIMNKCILHEPMYEKLFDLKNARLEHVIFD